MFFFFLEIKSKIEHLLECTPRLYTSERWGSSFTVRTKNIKNYQPIKRDIVTHYNLFDREKELNQILNWVSRNKIV